MKEARQDVESVINKSGSLMKKKIIVDQKKKKKKKMGCAREKRDH